MYVKAEIIITPKAGDPIYCTLDQLCRDNPELAEEARTMMDYESITVGGGSAPEFTITRWR